MMSDFVHLHSHSDYSLLDGIARVDDMAQFCASHKQSSLAQTDHGTLAGSLAFYRACKSADIKPILGMEAYQARRTINDRDIEDRKSYHLVLLAQNEVGWRNLVTLSTLASTEGMFFKQRVDKNMLAAHSEGLVCLSGCLGGELARAVMDGDTMQQCQVIDFFKRTFPGRYYLEMQDHGQDDDKRLNSALLTLSTKYDVPLVATQDFHYVNAGDKRLHEIVLAIQTHSKMSEKTEEQGGKRFAFLGDRFHMTTYDEMLVKGFPEEALRNTVAIAEQCNVDLDVSGKLLLPKRDGLSLREWLQQHPNSIPDEPAYQERLQYELKVLESLGFDDYMLIIKELVDFAKANDIMMGTGRGSVGGSLVAMALGIHNIDPIYYDLSFERFLNPNRVKAPDIDLDFDDVGRDRVIKFSEQKWGKEFTAQIGTLGTFAERSAVMFAAKALELPEEDHEVQEVAKRIDGMKRLTGKHAAGVCISPKKLLGFVPMSRSRDDKGAALTTQWDKDDIESLGLLKVDCLGVSRITTLKTALQMVEDYRLTKVNLQTINYNERSTFDMIRRCDVHGVFQFDTYGAKKLLRDFQPASIIDLAVITALDRPGTLSTGVVEDYIARKRGAQFKYLHPSLEPILKNTYGVMVFQEQAMQVVVALAGFTLAEADLVRDAIAKKHPEKMQHFKSKFMQGCSDNGVSRKVAEEVWTWLDAFSGYSFNKAHSVGYALLAYQTAWVKHHYPLEWYCALLNERIGDKVKLNETLRDARKKGIVVRSPHYLDSLDTFTIATDGQSIQFGLTAIPDFGSTAYESLKTGIQKTTRLANLNDLLMACNMGKLNSKALTALIKAGALQSLGSTATMLNSLTDEIEKARKSKLEAYKWGEGKTPRWWKKREDVQQSDMVSV